MKREKRLFTKEKLEAVRDDLENFAPIEVYQEILKSIETTKFDWFGSITFTSAITDEVDLYQYIRKVKRFVNRHFYGKRKSKIKWFFVLHQDAADFKGLPKFHIHLFVSSPCEKAKNGSMFQGEYENLAKRYFKMILNKNAKKIKPISMNKTARVGRIDFKPITDQENLADYLLKELKPNHPGDLRVDIMNSDLEFGTNDNS